MPNHSSQIRIRKLTWTPGGTAIPFIVGHHCLAQLTPLLDGADTDRILVVTESHIWDRFGHELRSHLPSHRKHHAMYVPSGESGKNLAKLEELACQALTLGASRRTVILSFGGGLVCNVAGMLASLLFRGIRLVHIPTTLLAMHDTVTSLKQAVNIAGRKNLLGTYHAPAAIVCDVSLAQHLPPEAIQAALVEIVKNALILGRDFVPQAQAFCTCSDKLDPVFLMAVIESGVAAKNFLMQNDPNERHAAIAFEYGHTIGHAIESLSHLAHGHCIYWGMRCAADIALALQIMSPRTHERHTHLLSLLGPAPQPAHSLPLTALLDALIFDNKRGYLRSSTKRHIDMVLLSTLGHPVRTQGRPLTPVSYGQIRAAQRKLPFVVA